MDEPVEIPFYDVIHRQQIRVPISQIHKSVFKQAARNGKIRIHYLLTARLNGTVLRKLVRRKDWLERPTGLNPLRSINAGGTMTVLIFILAVI